MLGGIDNGLFLKSFSGFAVVAVLALLLRWAFSRGKSLVASNPQVGSSDEYGLVTPVADPKNFISGEILRQHLLSHGIKANLTQTLEGPKLMVFLKDEKVARAVLAAFSQTR